MTMLLLMTTMMTMAMVVEKINNQSKEGGEYEDCRCRKKLWRLWKSG
jgi:hypothetical protein